MDRKLIDQYVAGGGEIAWAIEGLSQEDLLWTPPEEDGVGLWSIQQIVIHLMDADLIWATRMKRIIAEDHPEILGYDESKFAANLFYELQDAAKAVEIFDLNRRQFTKALRRLSDSAFQRTGQHNERGTITLETCLRLMDEHVDHHVKFIRLKREKLGKPLKA
ncbi:MAG: DinB family protein [Tepidisphaeraceae bacterium]